MLVHRVCCRASCGDILVEAPGDAVWDERGQGLASSSCSSCADRPARRERSRVGPGHAAVTRAVRSKHRRGAVRQHTTNTTHVCTLWMMCIHGFCCVYMVSGAAALVSDSVLRSSSNPSKTCPPCTRWTGFRRICEPPDRLHGRPGK